MKPSLPKCFVCLTICLLAAAACVHCSSVDANDDKLAAETRNSIADQQEALEEFNSLIGGWRGSGQPKRGSSRGAWLEKANWIWEFEKGNVAIRYDVDKGKLVKSALLTYNASKKQYEFAVEMNEAGKRVYSGNIEDRRLVLESKADKDGYVHRIRVTRLNPKRTLVLFERRRETQKFYSRVAEVGYTRQGTRLASSDVSGPICIVTGGTANASINYKGKKYYVCCTGCREAFNDDPEGVIAAAAKKEKERKAKAEAKKAKEKS